MFFSEYFQVDSSLIEEYGAVDISLTCDMPLFIDPMLIFNSGKREYIELHEKIIKYFHFLYQKAEVGLSPKEIKAWFNFSEVPNNWLGYSLSGNKGLALGDKYAKFLYTNIAFAIGTNNISKSNHIEKIMLLYEGSGKDKISDLTVNLIKGFLCDYTEKFSKKYIEGKRLKIFPVEKAYFNYETESFISKEYTLPFVYDEKGRPEYVLLTPYDILREDEPAINRRDFLENYNEVRQVIDNDILRTYVNNYIGKAVREYEKRQQERRRKIREDSIQKIEKKAFEELVREYPILYDYYIKFIEDNADSVCQVSRIEYYETIDKLVNASKDLIALIRERDYIADCTLSAREEAKKRIKYFKHVIEDCDGYKNLYYNGQPIAFEKDLQRLFRFVWFDTGFKLDGEVNNGRGQADFIVSKGQWNQNIIEFKLASNNSLPHVFTQVEIYEAANCADGSIIVIFYFTEEEFEYAKNVVVSAGYKEALDESIFLIDCRKDNKISASKA